MRAPIIEIAAPPESRPRLDAADDLNALISPEEAAALASGGEIDLDVRGPWPPNAPANEPGAADVPRCARCSFELFPGNSFCVECGARIEAAIA